VVSQLSKQRMKILLENLKSSEDSNGAFKTAFDNESFTDRAIAEAVSRWLPTAAARVRALVWQVRFVVDQLASG
jgi:hypothetical protein